ncbi:hypothetical protein IU438_05240 [Nocardia cyriacigeorgica]|uniref:DUF6542 domain-containing protein n=1 Tax=Nocardia cyriacigeorgica TaxID=135487 RepID=UPI001894870C|nr:DUF6542 domain-containing protein [Nocardia cyriacigeorgica]MBF6395189.1 hypothetical protein [Nocardia cyriacigeorgica]MBF6400822.1 hypothetical protein [Nocardia cyriacigeorgica]
MAASQRVRTRVPAPQRSILPSVPGVPAGAAVLIAVACTFLGFLIDALGDGTELTGSFTAFYVIGCVAAVLAVRFRGLFTTLVLPPLLLFVAVPLAYQQLLGRASTSIKDILLNLAIPLVHRFPTMVLTTVIVLCIGGARIALDRAERAAEGKSQARRGTSWGRSAVQQRPKKAEPGSQSLSGAARKRSRRPPVADDYDDVAEPAARPRRQGKRRPPPVAENPPRLAAAARSREGRPRGGARPTAAARPEAEPVRGPARRRTEQPPLPQPTVRYRDRDSGRIERRGPEAR